MTLLRTVVLAGSPRAGDWGLLEINAVVLGVMAVYAALWFACRSGPRSPSILHATDAAALVLAGLTFGCFPLAGTPFVDTVYPMVIAIAYVLLARAVIVPSTPARTLALSAAASAPALLGIWLHAWEKRLIGLRVPGALDAVIQTAQTLAAIGLAVLASRVIYGLRAEVREARRVGQYTLEEKLGEGGMGVVYRARHAFLKRPTAVKLLLPERAGGGAVERFEREVQLTARLTHPNTVAVFDYGRTLDGVFYYVMELIESCRLCRHPRGRRDAETLRTGRLAVALRQAARNSSTFEATRPG